MTVYIHKDAKLVLDSKTPLNKGNIFVPDENYNIALRTSSPQDVATYSGVIVERTAKGERSAQAHAG